MSSRFRCDRATTTTPNFRPDLTTPYRGRSRGTGQGQYLRSTVAGITPGGSTWSHRAELQGSREFQGKAGNDRSYHQGQDLLPRHRHRRCRGAHRLHSRIRIASDVGGAHRHFRAQIDGRGDWIRTSDLLNPVQSYGRGPPVKRGFSAMRVAISSRSAMRVAICASKRSRRIRRTSAAFRAASRSASRPADLPSQ